MDTANIDQAYSQLQTEFQDVANSVHTLAAKLNAAVQTGDRNAREWLLDLKQIALDVKDEQMQVNALLQAIHAFIDSSNRQLQMQQPQPFLPAGYQSQQMTGRRGGMFGGLLGGTFGQAIEMGAGIGLGEDIINHIF